MSGSKEALIKPAARTQDRRPFFGRDFAERLSAIVRRSLDRLDVKLAAIAAQQDRQTEG